MRIKFVALLIAVLAASPAISQECSFSTPQLNSCIENAAAVTPDVISCISVETELQDRRLNVAYKKLQAELTSGQQSQLKKAQRAWVGYRDANSSYYYDPDGGQDARIASAFQYLNMTAERVKELEIDLSQAQL